jgi:hypothetical protein
MSFVAKGTRRIAVTPEVAFDRLADFTSWPRWMPSSFRPVGTSEGTLRLGQKLLVRIAGIPVASKIEVTEVRRPKEIAWSGGVPGVLWANHQFFFEADGADATTVVSHETWSGVLASLVRPMVQPKAELIGGQQLDALARSLT